MDYIAEKQSLGQSIRREREARGISQRKLALMTGTSRSYLWKVETGRADVGLDVLCRIAQAIDTPVRDLIDF